MKETKYLFLVLFISLNAMAAVSTPEVLGILSLSESSRMLAAKKNPNQMYPALIKVAFSQKHSTQMRWKALILAAQINAKGARKDLEKAAQSNEWFMRSAALLAFRITQPEIASKLAVKLLSDKALVVRSAAVNAISDKQTERVRDILWSEVQAKYNFHEGQSLWVRGQLLEKLAHHPQKREYSLFASAVKDSDESLHWAAISALEILTGKKIGNSNMTSEQKQKLWVAYLDKHPLLN